MEQLKTALNITSCPLTLFTDLDVSVPLDDIKTVEEIKTVFERRIAKEVKRLNASPRPILVRIGRLLAEYRKDSNKRMQIPRARPTPTYMSAFIPMDLDAAAAAPELLSNAADMPQ